jgi:hypothetical protein
MLVLRSAALLIALIMMSAPRTVVGQAQSQPAAIAPEHQETNSAANMTAEVRMGQLSKSLA